MDYLPTVRRHWLVASAASSILIPLQTAIAVDTNSTWLSPTSGSWTTISNWSTPTYPKNDFPAGSSYNVFVNATGSPYTVSLNTPVTVNNLTLASPATLSLSGSPLTINNRLDLTDATIRFTGSATLAGPGDVALHIFSLASPAINWSSLNSYTLTLGPTLTLHNVDGGTSIINVINQGTITAEATGKTLYIGGTSSNSGVLSALPGATLAISGTLTNTGTITASPGSTIALNGTATLVNSSTTTIALGSGTLTLASGTTIRGGSITSDPGGPGIVAPPFYGGSSDVTSIDAAALSANLTINNNALVRLTNGATLPSRVTLASTTADGSRYTYLQSFGQPLSSSTPSGTEIIFDGTAPFNAVRNAAPFSIPPLDIGPSILIRTGTQGGIVGNQSVATNLQGVISAQTPGKTIYIYGSAITLSGTLTASNGGTISVPINLTNLANSTLSGGTYAVADNSTLALPTTFTTNAATIVLSGPNSSLPAIAPLATNTGSLSLNNGRSFTTTGDLANSGSITLGPDATLHITGTLLNPGTINLSSSTATLLLGPGSSSDTVRLNLLTSHLSSSTADTIHRLAYHTSGTATRVILALTGDTNLNGKIDPDDYAILDRSYAQSKTNAYWLDGDFDYDGIVTSADYLLIDATLASQALLSPAFLSMRESQFGTGYICQLLLSIPEPSSLTGLIMGLSSLSRRRR